MSNAEPRPDPLLGLRLSLLRQLRRIMKWTALFAVVVAAIAVLLVAGGETAVPAHMLIAIALGAGLSVLIAGAIMSLLFLSVNSGHDEATHRFEEDEHP